MKRQQGVVLLVVLWVLAVLSSLLGVLAATVQLQHRQAMWLGARSQAMFAAQAGLSLAVVALQARDPRARWAVDGQAQSLDFGAARLWVKVRSERGKLDLNVAPASAVRRVLMASGAAAQTADRIVQALEQRRNGSVPLRTLEEFRELDGVTFELYRRVLPLLTVWSGQAQPEAALAPVPLLTALGLPISHLAGVTGGQIFTVDSEAQLPSGDRATLSVTLILTSVKEGARPYRVLRWQE